MLIIAASQNAVADENTLKKSSRFIESLEWDDEAFQKIESFRKFESLYLDLLKSAEANNVFVSAVMLGLLKTEAAVSSIQTIKPQNTKVRIGVSFALCRLNIRYEENYSFLEKVGFETQLVGGAISQKHLEAIEFLSFLGDDRFLNYVKTLKTEESFQREAIAVASLRYNKMKTGL